MSKQKPIIEWTIKDRKFPSRPTPNHTGRSRSDVVAQLARRWGISDFEASERFIIAKVKPAVKPLTMDLMADYARKILSDMQPAQEDEIDRRMAGPRACPACGDESQIEDIDNGRDSYYCAGCGHQW